MVLDVANNRAWIEINLHNLVYNIDKIKDILPRGTNIMAVVKADAYGHGMARVALKLEKIDINFFAVASLEEGITLRKNGVKGNILILGYTHYDYLHYVLEYDLIQTIVDYDYALQIEKISLPSPLKVHLKINTGMNRLGESYKNISNILDIYAMKNLKVLGIFTHLCVADSLSKSDTIFTRRQINNFNKVVAAIKEKKLDVGKVHIQSSYGLLNYNDLKYDYVRLGIIMYGTDSVYNMETRRKLYLKPVLSLKARITSVRTINPKESVGYGRSYEAKNTVKIASVSIGYADGLPRNLSGTNMSVLVNGHLCKIVGRVCMDQITIDVSSIDVTSGDIVSLIDSDFVPATKMAEFSSSITNEILSRLGSRLERIYLD